ncbi:hypothetical protein C2S52_001207 [Perilla frutescens var. hirtella]|nr:hypothetical protein C2S51_007279 [Perilla frutescens var. frutescens]KAH6800743.1 hypothetical protein C2S52_001207 [Perilla frutescens var. hirtella]
MPAAAKARLEVGEKMEQVAAGGVLAEKERVLKVEEMQPAAVSAERGGETAEIFV